METTLLEAINDEKTMTLPVVVVSKPVLTREQELRAKLRTALSSDQTVEMMATFADYLDGLANDCFRDSWSKIVSDETQGSARELILECARRRASVLKETAAVIYATHSADCRCSQCDETAAIPAWDAGTMLLPMVATKG